MKQTKEKQTKTFRALGVALFVSIMAVLYCIAPSSVFATTTDFTLSKSSMTLKLGNTDSFTITSGNGVGELNVVSLNTMVAEVDKSSVFIDNPGDSQSITVTAKGKGFTTIQVVSTSNYADFDTEEPLLGQIATLNVTVEDSSSSETTPPSPTPAPSSVDSAGDEGNMPVPNTSGSETRRSGTKTPDTGENTKEENSSINIVFYILPVMIAVIVGALYIKHTKKAHRKFD